MISRPQELGGVYATTYSFIHLQLVFHFPLSRLAHIWKFTADCVDSFGTRRTGFLNFTDSCSHAMGKRYSPRWI